MFLFVVTLSSLLLFVGVYQCISFHYYQNLAPDHKKIPATREKVPRSRPVSWNPRTGPSPESSKIRPGDPNFYGVARSGPGIPNSPGCPTRLLFECVMSKNWIQRDRYGVNTTRRLREKESELCTKEKKSRSRAKEGERDWNKTKNEGEKRLGEKYKSS